MPPLRYPCRLCSHQPFDSERALHVHQSKRHQLGARNSNILHAPLQNGGPGTRPHKPRLDRGFWKSALGKRKQDKPPLEDVPGEAGPSAMETDEAGIVQDGEGFGDDGLVDPDSEVAFPVISTPSPPPPPLHRGKPSVPVHLQDILPPPISTAAAEEQLPRIRVVLRRWRTKLDSFRIFREFYGRQPDVRPVSTHAKPINQLSNSDKPDKPPEIDSGLLQEALGPFPNYSTFLYAKWFLESSSGRTSAALSNEFTRHVLADPRWRTEDVVGLELNALKERIAKWEPTPLDPKEGWKRKDVYIDVPLGRARGTSARSVRYLAGKVNCRGIVPIVRNVIATDPNVKDFFLHPFCEYQKQDDGSMVRLISESVSADRFREYHNEVQDLPAIDGCSLERVVLGLMFWSDSTHLAQFGSHKLWPLYMVFANQPQWQRNRHDMGAWHDVAHIPGLPKSFQDFVTEHRIKPADRNLLAHCRRELFHAVWELIMDPEFVDAHENGIVLEFHDGTKRRVFLRLLSYSADYPEK